MRICARERICYEGETLDYESPALTAELQARNVEVNAFVLLDQFIQPNMQKCGRLFCAYLSHAYSTINTSAQYETKQIHSNYSYDFRARAGDAVYDSC